MSSTRPPKILLVQVRAPDDPMLEHERLCVQRRLGARHFELKYRNAVPEKAGPSWLEGIDGVIIGGSGDFSVHHPKSTPWVTPLRTMLDDILRLNVPCFAICFGHQMLGLHLGEHVKTDPDYAELGTVAVNVTDEGQKSPLFDGFNKRLWVHSGHSDHVTRVPEGVDLLASNSATHTQAFFVRGTQTFSVQFHPDMTGAEARYRYLAYRQGFAARLDPTAESKADQFKPDLDESVGLIGRFYDICFS